MASLNLKPYGIDFVLRPGVNTISDIGTQHLERGLVAVSRTYFVIGGVKYNTVKQLGSGSYGTTYSVTRHGGKDAGKPYAIKHIKLRSDYEEDTVEDIHNLLKESIQQIIIAKHTQSFVNGPYAPNVHKIGYDWYHKEAFIVSDLMDNTVWNLISSQTREQNDKTVPFILAQTSAQLIKLQNDLKFNHRDLKTDNVMYTTNPDGTINVKFIDFGFTCLTWNGMFISGGNYFKHSPKCYRETRDITQLIASILWFHKEYLSAELIKRLESILSTKHGVSSRTFTKYMGAWTNSYGLLDRNNYVFEYGNPSTVIKEMELFETGKPFEGRKSLTRKSSKKPAVVAPAPVPGDICPPDKIINPATRRCVLRSGAIGRKLEKEQAVPAVAAVPAAPADDCPPEKIRNPKTRRCVKRTGAIGKRLP